MAKPPMTAKLARTISTKDGTVLRTRGEAATYMTGLPEQRAHRAAWQAAAGDLLTGEDAERLTRQLELALMLDGYRRFR